MEKEDATAEITRGVAVMVASSPVSGGSSCDSALPMLCDSTIKILRSVQGRTTGPTRRSAKGGWTKEEDDLLTEAVRKFNGKNWKRVAESFPGRSDVQCLHRWQKVLNPDLVKGPWTKEEDDRIIELVEKYGCKKWSAIATYLPGRIGKQCRERWHNHLNPAIKKDAWTKEEELELIRAHRVYGNKWAEIARFLPGRADNSIKNHWNCSVKKKLDLFPGEYPGLNSPGFCNHEKKESLKVEVAKPSPGVVHSLNQKMELERPVHTSLKAPLPGNKNGGQKGLEIKHMAKSSKCLQGGVNCKISQPGFQLNGKTATGCSPVVECRGGESEHCLGSEDLHCSVVESEVSSGVSPGDSGKSMYPREHIHECGDHIDLSPKPASGQNSMAASSRRYPLDVTSDVALSVTTKRVPESPKRPRHYASPISECGGLSRFSDECNHPLRNLSAGEFGSEKSQFCSQNKVPTTPQHVEDINFLLLNSESTPGKNADAVLANGRLSSTDNYARLANSPVCSTPPSHMRSVSVNGNTPGSILRSAARTYKNTPSIIRKRRHDTFTQAPYANDLCTPEQRSRSSKDVLGSAFSCPSGLGAEDDLNSINILKKNWLSLSAPNSLQPETIPSLKSVEKRLQYAFDMEWDKSKCSSSTLSTGNDSSGDNLEQSTVSKPLEHSLDSFIG